MTPNHHIRLQWATVPSYKMPHSKSSNDSSRSSRSSSGYFEEYSSDDSNSSAFISSSHFFGYTFTDLVGMYSHTSLLITPSNPKAVNTSGCDKMYPALAADLKGCFAMVEDSDQRFEEYIKNVYGLTQDDVDYVNNKHKKGGWVLDGKHLREFQRVVAEHDHETKLYAPFKGMADAFYKVMERDRHSIDVELRTLGSMQLKCPYSKVTRKPDGLFLLKSLPSKPTWAYAKAYLEMYLKKKTAPSQPTIEPISFEASSSKQAKPRKSSASVAKPPAIKAQSTNALFTPAEKPKQLPDRRHSDDYSYPRRSTRACAIQSLAKIQAIQEEEEEGDGHGNDDDGDEGFFGEATSKVGSKRKQTTTETSSSRKRVNVGITRKVCQSASYALESLSATPRRWSTGLLIEGSVISVQYFDRCGGIVTPPFDFIEEPHKFALILLGIGKASLTQAGYDPYFVAPDSKSLANSLPTITDAHLILPPLAPTDADELYTGSTTPDDTWSRFVIKEDPLYVYHGLNGRGSMVWPGTWQRKEAVADGEDKEADADAVPVVSVVVPEEGDDDGLGQIVKLSWPDKGRPRHEPKILQELFEKMPAEMHEYLPQVHASVLMTADVAGLPRAFFINQAVGNLKRQFEFGIRHFAIMIVDRYRYLWTVDTVEEFENVYVDLVKGTSSIHFPQRLQLRIVIQ